MIVLCTGMPRSGSTWSFNVCRLLFEHVGRPVKTAYVGPTKLDELLQRPGGLQGDVVVKIHDPGPAARRLIQEKAIYNVHTWRDPRDAVASARRLWGTPLEIILAPGNIEAYAALASEWLHGGHSLFLGYDTIRDDPSAGVARIVAYLGVAAGEAACREVASATSFERHKQISSDPHMKTAEHLPYNPVTLLHRGHIQDGRSGYWKEFLTPAQGDAILQKFEPELLKLWGIAER